MLDKTQPTKEAKQKFNKKISQLSRANLLLSISFASWYLALAIVPYAVLVYEIANQQYWTIALLPLTAPWVGVMQRALENLVHDVAHYNWHRKNGRFKGLENDIAGAILVAAPVMQWLALYRPPHLLHHKHTGEEGDPCLNRVIMQLLGVNGEPTRIEIALFAFRNLLAINKEYYKTQFSDIRAGAPGFVLWHLVVMILPAAYLIGFWQALAIWVVYWMLPMTGVLPVIRAVAERWEHDYATAVNGAVRTFSNIGWVDRFIFHPAGDAFHAAHHRFPGVPAYRMRRLHEFLMEFDATFPHHPVRLF